MRKIAIRNFLPKNFEMISTPFKRLFEVSKSIYGPQSFHFCQQIWGLSIFHESKSSQKALGPFFTLKNQKYCEVVNFSINFTKFKKLYQRFIRILKKKKRGCFGAFFCSKLQINGAQKKNNNEQESYFTSTNITFCPQGSFVSPRPHVWIFIICFVF